MFKHVLFSHNCPIRINYRISRAMSAFYVFLKLLLFSFYTTLPLLRHTWFVQIAQITGNHRTFGPESLQNESTFYSFCWLFYKHLFFSSLYFAPLCKQALPPLLPLSTVSTDCKSRLLDFSSLSGHLSGHLHFAVVVITGNTECLSFFHLPVICIRYDLC